MQKLDHRQKVRPFRRLTLAEDPKICFKFLVYPFRLAISLRVVGSGQRHIVFEKSGQLLRKGRGKLRTVVRDYFVVKTKAGENMFEKQSGNAGGVDCFVTRDENHPLRKPMVDHDQNRVKTRRQRQIRDHVARNLLKRARGRGGNWTKPRDSGVSVNLVGLASSAASHKSVNKGGETGPPVVVLNQVNGAEISAVSSSLRAMQRVYQLLPGGFGNVETALVVESTVEEHPIVASSAREE